MRCFSAALVLVVAGACGARAHVEPSVEPSITVSNAGAEPRSVVRYELTPHVPELVVVDVKARSGSADVPTVELVGRFEVSAIAPSGEATIDYEVENVTVLDDVVEPAVRQQAPEDASHMTGMHMTWQMAPSGRMSQVARFTASSADTTPSVKSFADSVQDTAVVIFPSEPIGVGASWQVSYDVKSSGVRWNRSVTYRLKALTDSTATVDVEVIMHAPAQTLSVEPNASTTLTSATFAEAGEVVVARRGLVGAGTSKAMGQVDLQFVGRHEESVSTKQSEITVSIRSIASALAARRPAPSAPLADASAASTPLVGGASSSIEAAITGFYATGSGELSGHANDATGRPLGGVEVHVVSRSGGERSVRADRNGNYTLVLKGAPDETSMIFVRGHPGAHIGGVVAASVQVDGVEGVDIHETLAPKVPAKPVASELAIPDYSDAAKAADVWARAWIMLDIDRNGVVRQIKMIKRPGYGLDEIAVRDAFKLRFDPARNRANQLVSSLLLWTYEWPSYSWLTEHHKDVTTLPTDVANVVCQIEGMPRVQFRDCTQPDVTAALDEPWMSPKR